MRTATSRPLIGLTRPRRPCAVPGCDRPYRSKGYCETHYQRWRAGDARPDVPVRIWRHAPQRCTVDGCSRPPRSGGLCAGHYARRRAGDLRPDVPIASPASLEARFWRKVDRREPDECWPWIGALNADGVGTIRRFGHAGPTLKAPRVAVELDSGPLPAGAKVRRLCALHSCVNPAHLQAERAP